MQERKRERMMDRKMETQEKVDWMKQSAGKIKK